MNSTQKQALQAFKRVMSFLGEAQAGGSLTSHLEALGEIVERLKGHAVEQDAGLRLGRATTRKKHALQQELRLRHMRPIAALAEAVLPTLAATPGSGEEVALQMPSSKLDALTLVSAAGAMAAAAAPHRATFVQRGLPADFVEQLQTAAGALDAAMTTRSEHAARRAGATAGVAADLERGRRVIRLLDALVTSQLQGDAVRLAEWRSVKRIAGVGGTTGGSIAAPAAASEAPQGAPARAA